MFGFALEKRTWLQQKRATIGVGRTLLGEDIAGSRIRCRRNTANQQGRVLIINFQESSGAMIRGRFGKQAAAGGSRLALS
jgi:hypothetical protein